MRDEVGRDSSQNMEFSNCISVEMGSLWNAVALQNVQPTYSWKEVGVQGVEGGLQGMYKSPNWKRTYHFHGIKRRSAGAETIYTKEHKMKSERQAGPSVNCIKKFGFEIWTFI